MASNQELIFGAQIKFDKLGGVSDADLKRVLNQIQNLINKNELWVKLNVDPKSKTFIDNYGKSAGELEARIKSVSKAIESLQRAGLYWRSSGTGMTNEAKRLQQTLHELTMLRKYSSLTGTEFEKMLIRTLKEEQKERERTAKAAEKQAKAVERANSQFQKQDGYLQHLVTRMAAYASIGAFGAFLTTIREVTAEFQLQQISLGAIIQDQQRANQLFEEIKTFALKSPVKILDLTKYTKQLAAYRIETDKLFDTTKRLADISVGLGVSMDRLVLFYGQVRATGYLRASEVRQATEAGIPLVEELAKKLSQVNGELVTAKDVMDMISKREISFQNVADVFEDMTSKGGVFYNMQEKQGNTLYGMWQKLGDAAAIMYDQIGNTTAVNNSMKMTISILRNLMLNWKQVGIVLGSVGALVAMNIIHHRNLRIATALTTAENQKHILSLAQKVRLLELEQSRIKGVALGQRYYAAATLSAAKAELAAATATNVFTKAFYSLKAAFLSNPFGIAIIALTTLIGLISTTESETTKLTSKLQDIDREYGKNASESKNRFKELVDMATSSVDGSKRQKEALDELNRSYSSIFDSEYLEIENLKKIKDNYDEATAAIQAYNEKRKGGERETAIKSSYERQISEAKDTLTDYLRTYGASENQIADFFAKVDQDLIDGMDGVESIKKHLAEIPLSAGHAFDNALKLWDFGALTDAWQTVFRLIDKGADKTVFNYVYLQDEMNQKLDENRQKTDEAVAGLGSYLGVIGNLERALGSLDWSSMDALNQSLEAYNNQHPNAKLEIPIDVTFNPGNFKSAADNLMETANLQISTMFETLKQIAAQEGVEIPQTFYQMAKSVAEGNKDFSWIDFESIKKLSNSPEWGNIITTIQGLYENLAPSDETIRVFNRRFNGLIDKFDVLPDKMQKYLMKSGDNLGEHRKKLSDEITNLLKEIARLEWTKKWLGMFGLPTEAIEKEMQTAQETVKLLQEAIGSIPDIEGIGKKSSGGQDPRLSILQEMVSTIKNVNKEYDDLLKKEGQTKALADTQKIYADTFKNMQDLAKKYKFNLPEFEVPTDTSSLTRYLNAIKDAMKKLPKSDKAVLALQVDIDKIDIEDAQKKIDRQLKQLQERIAASKTAKEFYDKILSTTGDVDIAASVTMSIYGEDGTALQSEIAQQIKEMFGSFQVDVPVDIVTPENRVDYTALQRFLDENRDEWANKDQFKALEKLASEGQKASAQQVEAWFKEIQKAKDYAQKRVDIETDLANKIAAIRAEMLPKDVEETLISGMTEKAAQELDKLQYEAFKESPMYVELFQDLEHASTTALTAMRDRLIALKGQWQNLDPRQVKELTKSIQKLDEQIIANNPFKALITNLTDLRKMKSQKVLDENLKTELAKLQQAEEKLANASKKYADAQTEVENAETDVAVARNKLNDAIDSEDYDAVKEAQEELNIRLEILDKIKEAHDDNMRIAKREKEEAEDEYNKQKEITDKVQQEANARKQALQNIKDANSAIDEYQSIINDTLGDVREMMEALGADDIDLQFFDDIVQGLNQIVDAGQVAATAVGAFMTGDLFTGITQSISAISGFVTGFINLFYAGRVRKANKEIKRQQNILDQLEYTYGRLQKAQDKLFGSDYIQNYRQQLENLSAQAKAYQKQADAERSKGKKADEEKIKEYENAARDAMDEIKDMRDDLVNYFAGTDITSAARDFANSWLEARWAFEDTTEAMREKFADMVQNMIVESMAARIMQNILEPIYDMIDGALADNDLTTQEIAAISSKAYGAIGQMNDAMETMLAQLEKAGLNLSQIFSEGGAGLTGITRDYATASEESINGLAQGINTQNYYISHVPTISENVAAIRILMEGGAVAQTGGDLVGLQNEHLSQLPIIAANTLATAERCERAAVACEEMANNIRRVVEPKGGKFILRTTLN